MDFHFGSNLLTQLSLLVCIAFLTLADARELRERTRTAGPERSTLTLRDANNCTTLYHTQTVDHFAFHNNATYQQRYLVCDRYYKPGGPILFYTGNEGDILLFADNTGFMFDIAPEFNALLIFAEHRYYGVSVPADAPGQRFYYQSVVQVLADYNELILHLKRSIQGGNDSAVIVMGGSYGGMLSAWFRMKYPSTAVGALAASAPIWGAPGLSDCNAFARITTNDYKATSPACADNIRQSWNILNSLSQNATGQQRIMLHLQLCGTWDVDVQSVDALKGWLLQAWSFMAMVDYPYIANFVNPLPPWPVQESCRFLMQPLDTDIDQLLNGVRYGMDVFYNFTGEALGCFNISKPLDSLGAFADQWNYQSCTEMVIPSCSDGVQDMFEPAPWDAQQFIDGCQQMFGVTPNFDFVASEYGGHDLSSYSNIIFSNGNLDPWSGGGVLTNISNSLVSILIDKGAHHLDLRSADPNDPQAVLDARQQEKNIMHEWINSAKARKA